MAKLLPHHAARSPSHEGAFTTNRTILSMHIKKKNVPISKISKLLLEDSEQL
jgi:hypothetical protein